MRNIILGFLSLTLLALPQLALADMPYREFTGRIDRIDAKKMIVDNRQGDKVSFNRVGDAVVEGEGKKNWSELKRKDWVTVSWKFVDKPRKAYKVRVLPRDDD